MPNAEKVDEYTLIEQDCLCCIYDRNIEEIGHAQSSSRWYCWQKSSYQYQLTASGCKNRYAVFECEEEKHL